ncbi:MAG: hypothetical protein R3248_04185 [Candidatus Promineifilaceae bacterium]|nr:hypothetical protein [Candidatus Promineifilaceae bacterium]
MKLSYHRFLLIILLIGATIGCRSRLDATPETTPNDAHDVQLLVHLGHDRNVYSVGEWIPLGLQIVNERETPIEFHDFSFSALAYSPPHSMHLIGPDGEDRLLPFRLSKRKMDKFPPIQVGAGEEEGGWLLLSHYLSLRMPGRYSFWLELVDDGGNRYRSNRVDFELMAIDPSVPTDLIELSLQPEASSYSPTEPIRVKAIFKNNSAQAVTFLKPQDGSEVAWSNPIYDFTVTDEDGRSLREPPVGAILVGPIYDERSQFTLLPGESYEQKLMPLQLIFEPLPGNYQVQLTYIVHENSIEMGSLTDRPMNWEKDVFTGLIESNVVTIVVEP